MVIVVRQSCPWLALLGALSNSMPNLSTAKACPNLSLALTWMYSAISSTWFWLSWIPRPLLSYKRLLWLPPLLAYWYRSFTTWTLTRLSNDLDLLIPLSVPLHECQLQIKCSSDRHQHSLGKQLMKVWPESIQANLSQTSSSSGVCCPSLRLQTSPRN